MRQILVVCLAGLVQGTALTSSRLEQAIIETENNNLGEVVVEVDGKWYPDYSVSWLEGGCKNITPLPITATVLFDSQLLCCNGAFGGQPSNSCLNGIDVSTSANINVLCQTEDECKEQMSLGRYEEFEVGEFALSGCFTKDNILFWGTGGERFDETESMVDIDNFFEGGGEVVFCDLLQSTSPSSSSSTTTEDTFDTLKEDILSLLQNQTNKPTKPTSTPSANPTSVPMSEPTSNPTTKPTSTQTPSSNPTSNPTSKPTSDPSSSFHCVDPRSSNNINRTHLVRRGEETTICLFIGPAGNWNSNDVTYTRFTFNLKADEFSSYQIPNTFNSLVTSATGQNSFNSMATHIFASSQTSLSFLRRYVDNELKRIYPFLTAIIEVEKGIVIGITWDDACGFCNRSECQLNTYNFDGSAASAEQAKQPVEGCYLTREQCLGFVASGSKICDLKLYVVWSGTDVDGKALLSSDSRFSMFPPNRIQESVTSAYEKMIEQLKNMKDNIQNKVQSSGR
jgi:hypothetical protein